jgi:hypothetical protein
MYSFEGNNGWMFFPSLMFFRIKVEEISTMGINQMNFWMVFKSELSCSFDTLG